MIDAFSADQVDEFDRDGFLIVEEGLVSSRALDLLRERYEPLFWAPGTIEEIEYPGLVERLLGDFDISVDDDGLAKLLATHRALALRRDRADLFTTYAGVEASGPAADHVLAFDRGGAVTVATRLPVGLAERGGWGSTALALPEGTWTDVITGRTVSDRLDDILATHPVALLVREDS